MKTVREALELLVPRFDPIGAEELALDASLGRALAADLHARSDLPPFDNSAMDGYAIRHADVAAGPSTLPLAGASRAGGQVAEPLPQGHAQRIFTGALVPAGADTVVMQENTEALEGAVRITVAPTPGEHVRARGSDLRAGQLAVAAHTTLRAGEIALLASQGYAKVPVFRRPRVAILCTGDELREIGAELAQGQIINSNAYGIAAQVREAGAEPWLLPAARDDQRDLQDKLELGLRADVLLTSGGVSVGDHDLVIRVLAQLGVSPLLWKVALKPGKPVMFAVHERTPVVGLPGNPVSAFVCFELFVRPGLRRMLGHRALYRPAIEVKLQAEARHGRGRVELLRASLASEGGTLYARPHPRQGSGSLPSLVGVDALVVLPADQEHFAQGQVVQALLVGDHPAAQSSPF